MGWTTNIFEAAYTFSNPDLTATEVVEALRERIPLSGGKLVDPTDEGARARDVQNKNDGNNNSSSSSSSERVCSQTTTRIFRFVDDQTYEVYKNNTGKVEVLAFSQSRVGKGDLFKNQKTVRSVMEPLMKTLGEATENVIRS